MPATSSKTGVAGPAAANRLGRRGFVAAFAALATVLTLGPREVFADPKKPKKLKRVEKDDKGVTLTFELDHAPYGNGKGPWKDNTVIVYVPSYYRLPKGRQVDTLVHFHGHNATARLGLEGGRLREQLFDSKQNCILVVPQGPRRATSSEGGRLDERGGLNRLLDEVMREIKRHYVGLQLEKSSVAGNKGVGYLALSAHSGGYKVAARCCQHGGVAVNEVYLFDALYGEEKTFERWLLKKKGVKGRGRHKIMSHYTAGCKKNNMDLLDALQRRGAKCYHEKKPGDLTRAQLSKGEAVFIHTPQQHGAVTFSYNNLRDCLFASSFRRFVKSDWFKNKKKKRKIDRRG